MASAIERFTPDQAEVVVAGGGRRHPGLMRSLTARLAPGPSSRSTSSSSTATPRRPWRSLIEYLTVHGQPGNLRGATGARGRRVLGVVTPA
ncbi:MAG: anhydro-N-acetylmuramic acid kinase [Gemmatimonadales bacterium]